MIKLKTIITNNGATINNKGEAMDYKRGYQVSTQDCEIIPLYSLRLHHLKQYLAKLKTKEYLGVWIEKGKVYIDKSIHIDNAEKALQVGRVNKQISIYSWKKNNYIYC